MKQLKKDLKEKTIVELEKEAQKIREEVGRLRIEQKVKPQTNTNLIFNKRKQLAMVLTLLNEKKDLELLQQQ